MSSLYPCLFYLPLAACLEAFIASHLPLQHFTNCSAIISVLSGLSFNKCKCSLTNPTVSAEFITSQIPSEPMTINSSLMVSSMFQISGSDIRPMFLAQKSPSVLVIAIPGPSSSCHTRQGPTGLKHINLQQIIITLSFH